MTDSPTSSDGRSSAKQPLAPNAASTITSSTTVVEGNASPITSDREQQTPAVEQIPDSRDSDKDIESAKRTAEARTAFLASLQAVGSTADAGLQTRAADIASNTKVLAKQQEQLDKATAALVLQLAIGRAFAV